MSRVLDPAKALLKECNLSGAQMDVLRRASRKWKDFGYPSTGKGIVRELHNGEVETYNVCFTVDVV